MMIGITANTPLIFGWDCIDAKGGAFFSPNPGKVPYGVQAVRGDRSANASMAPSEPRPAVENA